MTADRRPLVPSRWLPPDDRRISCGLPCGSPPVTALKWGVKEEYGLSPQCAFSSLTQVWRLVLSDLVPFTQVIDIINLQYLFQAEMPSESSIQTFSRDVDTIVISGAVVATFNRGAPSRCRLDHRRQRPVNSAPVAFSALLSGLPF